MELPTGTVTFFFTDIEGSTNHARAFGPRWPEVLEQHHGILRNAIRGAGGIDVRTEGDAFFAVFRSPADAVRAAAAAQRELTQHQWPEDRTVRVRMGMHTGEGRLAGDDYIGLDVHRAARIAASAHGGQVLLSEATRALVANVSLDGLRLRGLGKHRLKDFDEPQLLYQIEVDGLPGDFPPPRTLETPLNLPVQLTSFIGRDHELAQITQLLRERRLLTLTGPGGTGKTRIAVESANRVGEDFPDGIYFVDLSALRDPRLVPSAILVALGRKPAPDRTVLDTVTSYLHDRSCLLVLDNYEQVVEAADVAHRILEEAPATKVIATSRVRLDVAGEQEFPIPPLDVPSESRSRRELLSSDSVRLFVERARAVRPAFELTEENAEAVALICARLDGLPLALELAAVQMRLLHPHELLGRLERRLAGLGTGSRDVPERQRSLRRTIEWSYELLSQPERTLFARLAVFAGGATLAAIDEVCNPEGDLGVDTFDGLAGLIDKSLIRHSEFPEESRFTMLETLREYGRERLETEFDRAETERRHAEFFTRLAEERGPLVRTAGENEVVLLIRDLDNFRAAMSWSIRTDTAELGLRIGSALWRFFTGIGHLSEDMDSLNSLLQLPSGQADESIRASAILAVGSLLYWATDYEATRQSYEEALAIYRRIGDQKGTLQALMYLVYASLAQADPDRALSALEETFELSQSIDDDLLHAELEGLMGLTLLQHEEYEDALKHLNKSIERFTVAGATAWVQEATSRLASVYRKQGRLDKAREALGKSIVGLEEIGGLLNVGPFALQFASVASAAGDHVRALLLGGYADALSDEIGGRAPAALMGVPDLRAGAATELDEATIDKLWREGRSLNFDSAMQLMRDEAES